MAVTADDIIAIARASNNLSPSLAYIDPDATFYEQGIDSLDALGIVLRVEEVYDVNIPDDEVEEMDSIAALVEYINQRVPQGAD